MTTMTFKQMRQRMMRRPGWTPRRLYARPRRNCITQPPRKDFKSNLLCSVRPALPDYQNWSQNHAGLRGSQYATIQNMNTSRDADLNEHEVDWIGPMKQTEGTHRLQARGQWQALYSGTYFRKRLNVMTKHRNRIIQLLYTQLCKEVYITFRRRIRLQTQSRPMGR